MKNIFLLFIFQLSAFLAMADAKYHPVTFQLSTGKDSYYEGEKVTFLIAITNNDKEQSYPVLLPSTRTVGQKLFYLNVYDKANNTHILRASEEKMLKMGVPGSGNDQVKYLKPGEQVVIPVYWNDNIGNYQTLTSSHHSFGVPLFAGQYKVNVCYNPLGVPAGDSIYGYYYDTEAEIPPTKLAMPGNGDQSNFCTLNIKKGRDTVMSVEGVKYFMQWDTERNRCSYYTDSIGTGGTNERLVHVSNLQVDSFTTFNEEYFYTHFTGKYAEYISRFHDGDIREYRKYRDYCPEELFTERYNDFKQKTYYAVQLPDGRFYNVSYGWPSGNKHQEMYYSADGTLCTITTYVYDKNNELIKSQTEQKQPCIRDLETGKSHRILTELIKGIEN